MSIQDMVNAIFNVSVLEFRTHSPKPCQARP